MQTTQPTENGYLFGNCIVIHHAVVCRSTDWLTYLKDTFQFSPPNDSHKTIIYRLPQMFEMFSFRSHLNMMCLYGLSGKTVPRECLQEIVTLLSKMIVTTLPNHKLLNMVGYKMVLYVPEGTSVPFGMVQDELYSSDFFGTTFPLARMRMYIRPFSYNESLDLFAMPCSLTEYQVMTSFYRTQRPSFL